MRGYSYAEEERQAEATAKAVLENGFIQTYSGGPNDFTPDVPLVMARADQDRCRHWQ